MTGRVLLFTSDKITNRGYPVKVVVSHLGSSKRKTIGYSALKLWNQEKELPLPAHPDYENLVGVILNIRARAATSQFLDFKSTVEGLLFIINKQENKKAVLLEDYFKKIVDYNIRLGSEGNAAAINTVRNELLKYAPGVTLEAIDDDFIEGYKRYKKPLVSDGTIKTYFNAFRSVYNSAVRDPEVKLFDKKPFRNAYRDLVVRKGRSRNRYLTKKQLRKMENAGVDDLTGAELRAVKLSLLQFYLGGADFADVYYLKTAQIYGDRVLLTRKKVRRFKKEFDVKVFGRAQKILKMYGSFTNEYVFSWRKDYTGYKTFIANHNDDLKTAQKKLKIKVKPINEGLTTKVMRHTFATLAKFEGIDPDIIRELMGHERTDVDTIYKDKYPQKIRDRAHKKILKIKRYD